MPMYTKSGRSLWPVLVGAVVVLLALVVVLAVTAGRGGGSPKASPSASVPVQDPTPTATSTQATEDEGDALGAAPTGCLAGPSVDAQMVVQTQQRAPHTTYGAVEVAASLMRWTNRYPFPSAAEQATIEAKVLSPEMAADMRDLAAGYAKIASDPAFQQNTPPGGHPFGTHYTVSTKPGRWLVDPSSTSDRVTVHLSLGVVVDGAVSTETYALGSPVLVWESGHWHVLDTVSTDVAALKTGGTAFTGGC